MRVSSKEFAYLTGSECSKNVEITDFTYDSRKVHEGSLFIATKGAKVDGHDYAVKASFDNAACVLINSSKKDEIVPYLKKGCAVITAKDTLSAFQRFASLKALESGATIVAVTGSCGKTTTKDMIASILSVLGTTIKTPGNLNSDYGLPLSVLNLEKGTKFGVFEMAADHVGDIDKLTRIVPPEVAAITNIGFSHLKSFESQENIAVEKGKIFLPSTKGFILNDNAFKDYYKKTCSDLTVCDLPFSDVEFKGLDGFDLKLGSVRFSLPLVGEHNLKDASLAVSVARSFGATDKEIAQGLSALIPSFGRCRVVKEGSLTVLEDCYNANYDSTEDAIRTVSRLSRNGSKHIILGDMKEHGKKSIWAHRKIGECLLNANCNNIYLYGDEIEACYDVLKKNGRKCLYTRDFEILSEAVKKDVTSGDLLLLKGSRVMAMERIYQAIRSVV